MVLLPRIPNSHKSQNGHTQGLLPVPAKVLSRDLLYPCLWIWNLIQRDIFEITPLSVKWLLVPINSSARGEKRGSPIAVSVVSSTGCLGGVACSDANYPAALPVWWACFSNLPVSSVFDVMAFKDISLLLKLTRIGFSFIYESSDTVPLGWSKLCFPFISWINEK